MPSLKIKTSVFMRATIESFPQLFRDISEAIITHSDLFSNNPYTPQQLRDFCQAMSDKTTAAREGSKKDRDARDLQRTICNNALLVLTAVVATQAMLASSQQEAENIGNLSKFTFAKIHPTASSPISRVNGVKGTWTGKHGQALVEWDRAATTVKVLYNVYKCLSQPDNPENWQLAGSTMRKKVFLDELPHLSNVWVKVAAVKNGVVSAPSEPVMVGVAAI